MISYSIYRRGSKGGLRCQSAANVDSFRGRLQATPRRRITSVVLASPGAAVDRIHQDRSVPAWMPFLGQPPELHVWFLLIRPAFVSNEKLSKWSSNNLEDYISSPGEIGCIWRDHYLFISSCSSTALTWLMFLLSNSEKTVRSSTLRITSHRHAAMRGGKAWPEVG